MNLLRIALLATVAIATSVAASAEQFPLQPVNKSIPADKHCGTYFSATTYGGSTPTQILFAYRDASGNTKGTSVPASRAKVESADGEPTYEVVTVNGQPGAVFRIPAAEVATAAPCFATNASK